MTTTPKEQLRAVYHWYFREFKASSEEVKDLIVESFVGNRLFSEIPLQERLLILNEESDAVLRDIEKDTHKTITLCACLAILSLISELLAIYIKHHEFEIQNFLTRFF